MDTLLQRDVAPQITTFPVEILTHIFEFYLNRDPRFETEFHGYKRYLVKHFSPIILMRVCNRWRAITLATPSLWTFITPSYDTIPDLRRWLAICPKYPLHLQLPVHPSAVDPVARDYARSVFNLFSREAYRWRSLSIDLNPDVTQDLANLLRSVQTAPLLLEDLKVDALSQYHQVSQTTLEDIVALLRRLKSLRRLMWIDSEGTVPLHPLPWGQLKTVIVNLPSSIEDIFSYLSQCSAATTIEFQSDTSRQPQKTRLPTHQFPHITLPNLTSLKLSRGCDPMWLLRHFTMPSLRSLDVAILRRNHTVLEDFVKRSPGLETLIIDEIHGSEYYSYKDEVVISDQDIIDYVTSPCLRTIPRVALDLLYGKKRTIGLIQGLSTSSRPFPPLWCWIPFWKRRFIGWWDDLEGSQDPRLLFSYKDGALEFTEAYHHDTSFRF